MQLTAGRNGFNSFDKGLVTNPDGSTDVWFGPKLSDGAPEANWGQTIPGKGWNMPFRLYGRSNPGSTRRGVWVRLSW